MKNGVVLLFGIFLLVSWMTTPALAVSEDEIDLQTSILCNREPMVSVHEPKFNSKDQCSGNLKIQGIAYKCGTTAEVIDKTREFFKDLKGMSKDRCMEYCQERGSDCEGYFLAPERCGHSISPDKALDMGTKIAHCGKSCSGQSFMYCSIYHGSYLKAEDYMFKSKSPNCYCRKKKQSRR